MKTTTTILALALPLAVTAAWAQDPDGPPAGGGRPGGPRRPPPLPLLQALDADHDGVITVQELMNATVALQALDANGDGKLTRDEYLPPRPPPDFGPQGRGGNRPPGVPPALRNGDDLLPPPPPPCGDDPQTGPDQHRRPPPPSPFERVLDANGDGTIDADEIGNSATALKKLDKDGDGKLTRNECRPPRPPPPPWAGDGDDAPPFPPPPPPNDDR